MVRKKIKEKKSIENVIEVVDTRKDRLSTKILTGFIISMLVAITIASVREIFNCGLTTCVLGGAGAGSMIMSIIWLVVNSLKA